MTSRNRPKSAISKLLAFQIFSKIGKNIKYYHNHLKFETNRV